MTGVLIAIFLGWAGGYRFYKKQIGLGILYLLTFGVFGIGWIVDIFSAVKANNNSSKTLPNTLTLDVDVMGAFAKCSKNPEKKRIEVIQNIYEGDPLSLETGFYENKPFYLVVDPKSGLDIGSLPSDLNSEIKAYYHDAKLSAVLTKRDIDYPKIKLTIQR